jgi:tetratricopeptide (TPR) repeat protein
LNLVDFDDNLSRFTLQEGHRPHVEKPTMLIKFRIGIAFVLAAILFPAAPAIGGSVKPEVPLFRGLGKHHRAVTTVSKEAQRYFDQGLTFIYAFNHDEAIRSFRQALVYDPDCAMAWWGIACANGPHINNPTMDPDRSTEAWEALRQARALAPGASEVEKALIEALAARYADPPPEDRRSLDQAYADAMRRVWQTHMGDADVGNLFAESMMDLRPWDLWTHDGQPQPGTEEILATLEAVLELDPGHPGANHLYIHTVEASPRPERGLEAADRLRKTVTGTGHLVHMPAHIYSRVGRWEDAAQANRRAIRVDEEYRRNWPDQGFYRIYMAHNHHFLSWAAMMQGDSRTAIESARAMISGMPPEFIEQAAFVADGYMTIAIEALMRFGRWEEILREPPPPPYLPITAAHRHFARAVAYAATDRLTEARAEQALFEDASGKVTEEMIVGNNSARHILDIARHMMAGEIAFQAGDVDTAVVELRRAVELEDAIRYNEAPDWIQPVRHTLGGVLLAAGRIDEAEAVYRADLRKNPENGWSLFGLARCLDRKGAETEKRDVEKRFAKAWSHADVKLRQTCLCLPPIVGM